MSLLRRHVGRRRHIGRRVVGVGVGVSLLVLGLEAPAFAAPTITSFTPTSGPEDCVVVITGTGFTESPAADVDVDFMLGTAATAAADSAVISATEIWATVPSTLTDGTAYNIRVTTLQPPAATSTGTFIPTAGAGACAPTIASFTPICGLAGTTVVITGTNLIGPDLSGGGVRFNPYGDDAATGFATHTLPDVDEPTSLSVIVPSGAADGPIRVNTFDAADGGQAFSVASFDVPPPDCVTTPPPGNTHSRSVTLRLRKHLIARGKVSLTDAEDTLTDCVAGVRVKIQRRAGGRWRGVGATTTNDNGGYRRAIKDKPGKYRAIAKRVSLNDGADICLKDVSPRLRHRH